MIDAIALADRCKSDAEGSRLIDGLAFRLVEERPGDFWSDEIGEDDVWHRRDPDDLVAFDPPPHLSTSMDAVMALDVGTAVRISSLRERRATDLSITDPTWRRWSVTLDADELGGSVEASAHTAPLAVLAAKLTIHQLRHR